MSIVVIIPWIRGHFVEFFCHDENELKLDVVLRRVRHWRRLEEVGADVAVAERLKQFHYFRFNWEGFSTSKIHRNLEQLLLKISSISYDKNEARL